jgi:hypothetical protein
VRVAEEGAIGWRLRLWQQDAELYEALFYGEVGGRPRIVYKSH